MKIQLSCGECMRSGNYDGVYLQEPNDDGFYRLKCNYGHETIVNLQEDKVKLLFEKGCFAIIDEYYRDAIVTFTSALEEFYRFFLEIVFIKNSISEEHVKSYKKSVDRSEQEFGAFFSSWILAFGACPKVLDSNLVKLRNDVVHKGKMASYEDALKYGQEVFDILMSYTEMVENKYPEEIRKRFGAQVAKSPMFDSSRFQRTLHMGFVLNQNSKGKKIIDLLPMIKQKYGAYK